MAPTVADRPPRALPVNTVILHNNGRDGDAQVMLKARDTRGHLVDPVSGLQKLMEKADGGVHQRHTWTKGAFSANPCNPGTIF